MTARKKDSIINAGMKGKMAGEEERGRKGGREQGGRENEGLMIK